MFYMHEYMYKEYDEYNDIHICINTTVSCMLVIAKHALLYTVG